MNITFSMLLERIAHAVGQSPLSVQCSSNSPIRAVSAFSMQRTLNEDTLYISASVPPVSQRPLHLLDPVSRHGYHQPSSPASPPP